MRHMIPRDAEQYEKATLCQYLLDFLYPQATKYDNIYFDCSNPHVEVRHIINALHIMDIADILPKNANNLSKAEICAIINEYLDILTANRQIEFPSDIKELYEIDEEIKTPDLDMSNIDLNSSNNGLDSSNDF